MKTASVILLSWGLTLLLLGFNVALYRTRASSPKPRLEGLKALTNTVTRVVRYRPTPPPPPPPPPAFNWGQLESEDYGLYVANLRRVGCPPKTIRDIILADVEKYYEGRRELLEAGRDKNFWRTGEQALRDAIQFEKNALALAREKQVLLKQLVGADVDAESLRLWQDERVAALLVGFAGDPRPENAVACYLRGSAAGKALNTATGGIVTAKDVAEQDKLYESLRKEMAQILTPAEYDELERRLAIMEPRLAGVEMSGDELRQFARLRATLTEPLREVFDLKRERSSEAEAELEKKLAAEVLKLLGPARFADYQRSQDDRFQEIYALTDVNELPKSTAIKLFEIRQAVDVQMEQARTDPALTDAERYLYFGALRVQSERAFARYLGPKIFAEYQKQKLGDRWFRGTGPDVARQYDTRQ